MGIRAVEKTATINGSYTIASSKLLIAPRANKAAKARTRGTGRRDSEMSVQASPSRNAKNKRNGKLGLPSQTENPISAETNVPACEHGDESARANTECLCARSAPLRCRLLRKSAADCSGAGRNNLWSRSFAHSSSNIKFM